MPSFNQTLNWARFGEFRDTRETANADVWHLLFSERQQVAHYHFLNFRIFSHLPLLQDSLPDNLSILNYYFQQH